MTALIPFEGSSLPAFLRGKADINNDLTSHVGNGGFPVLSIKGKVFTLVKSQERTVITRPDDPEEAATALEVVILRANPNLSKVYYAKGYEDGAAGAPDCYSNDGTKPAADATSPQCKTCAACAQNVWGSGTNGKGKACSDSRRIAIASAGQLNEPMLLRIPPATLKPLAEYGKTLANRGVPYTAVVTKLRFDREEATPKLTFTPVGFLGEDQFAEAQEVSKSELVDNIIGLSGAAIVEDAPAEIVEKPAPAAKAKPVVSDDELETAVAPAKKPAAVDEDEAPAPAKKVAAKPKAVDDGDTPAEKPKAKPAAKANLADDLDALLGALDD